MLAPQPARKWARKSRPFFVSGRLRQQVFARRLDSQRGLAQGGGFKREGNAARAPRVTPSQSSARAGISTTITPVFSMVESRRADPASSFAQIFF